MDYFCYLRFVFVMLSYLFIAALWSPARKGLTSWLSCVCCFIVFVTFSCGVLGQVWYLIVSISDLCLLTNYIPFKLHKCDHLMTSLSIKKTSRPWPLVAH